MAFAVAVAAVVVAVVVGDAKDEHEKDPLVLLTGDEKDVADWVLRLVWLLLLLLAVGEWGGGGGGVGAILTSCGCRDDDEECMDLSP